MKKINIFVCTTLKAITKDKKKNNFEKYNIMCITYVTYVSVSLVCFVVKHPIVWGRKSPSLPVL